MMAYGMREAAHALASDVFVVIGLAANDCPQSDVTVEGGLAARAHLVTAHSEADGGGNLETTVCLTLAAASTAEAPRSISSAISS